MPKQNLLQQRVKLMKKNKDKDTKKLKVKTGLKSRTIKVDYLARVEGEGALYIKTKGNQVEDVQLKIFEPPRFFEALLRGRDYLEAPDITSRICGICPVAYQMSAVQAMEHALGINPPKSITDLRRLLYCGEWIESHSLHVFMLHLPDFLGYPDAVHMAKDHPEWVRHGLNLKKWGNGIVQLLGGREIHPINVRIGGFYKSPTLDSVQTLKVNLAQGYEHCLDFIKEFSKLSFPDLQLDYEFICLDEPGEYPMTGGRLVSNRGLNIDCSEFEDHIEEIHVPYTHALHAKLKARSNYFVGPLARFNLMADRLPKELQSLCNAIGFEPPCLNPFKSIIARMVELAYAFYESCRLIDAYAVPKTPFVSSTLKESTGIGCTEAPRGILYHRYKIDELGLIQDAKIIPPTSQNQLTIEKDLHDLVVNHLHLNDEDLTFKCEQAIRNYDPCISCSTHFLKLHRHAES